MLHSLDSDGPQRLQHLTLNEPKFDAEPFNPTADVRVSDWDMWREELERERHEFRAGTLADINFWMRMCDATHQMDSVDSGLMAHRLEQDIDAEEAGIIFAKALCLGKRLRLKPEVLGHLIRLCEEYARAGTWNKALQMRFAAHSAASGILETWKHWPDALAHVEQMWREGDIEAACEEAAFCKLLWQPVTMDARRWHAAKKQMRRAAATLGYLEDCFAGCLSILAGQLRWKDGFGISALHEKRENKLASTPLELPAPRKFISDLLSTS